VIATESSIEFACFGGSVALWASGGADPERALADARQQLERWHDRFTRFDERSELSRFNAERNPQVRVSPAFCRFAEAVVDTARLTRGLVDGTLAGEIESAGYREDLTGSLPLRESLRMAPPRQPARPHPEA
jgi:thiamine biosynthesis lipoprotein ApbE